MSSWQSLRMRPDPFRPRASPRPFLWATALVVLVGEVLALYLLCAQQVHRAEARRQLLQAQARAFSECLTSVRGSTIASCTRALRVRYRHELR